MGQGFAFRTALLVLAMLGRSAAFTEPDGQQRTDLYGDALPARARARLGTLRLRDGALWIAFSPDGRTLAAASGGGLPRVRLWSVADGRLLESIDRSANVVEFSPDGQLLVFGQWGHAVLWDIATHRDVRTINRVSDYGDLGVAFSADGRTLVVDDAEEQGGHKVRSLLRLYDVATGRQLGTLPLDSGPTALALAGGDGIAVGTSAGEVGQGRLGDSRTAWAWQATGVRGEVLGFSADHSLAAIWAYHQDGSIRLWDLGARRERARVPLTWDDFRFRARYGPIHSRGGFTARPKVSFAPDGHTLALSAHGDIRLFELPSGRERQQIAAHESYITGLRFSPDGRRLASGAADGSLRFWDAETGGALLRMPTHVTAIVGLAFSADGRTLASAGGIGGAAAVWDVPSGRQVLEVGRVGEGVVAVGLSPETGSLVAGTWNDLLIFDLVTGVQRARVADAHDGWIHGIPLTPDGRTAVTAGYNDPVVRFWDLTSGRCLQQLEAAKSRGTGVLLARDGHVLVSDFFEDVRLWEPAPGKTPPWRGRRLIDNWVSAVALSGDGRVLAASSVKGPVSLWETTGRKKIAELRAADIVGAGQRSSERVKTNLALSSDGGLLAWSTGGVVEIYDARRRRVLAAIDSPEHELAGPLSFSPDDMLLAAGYGSGLIYLWEVPGDSAPGGGRP